MKIKTIALAAALLSIAGLWGCKKELNLKEPGNLVPKTVDQDPSLPSITVNGTQLHAETFGNPTDPMVIYLHGGPGADYRSGLNLQSLAANRYFVVLFDQRGSGLSKRHAYDSYSLQTMLDDVTAVIEHYRRSPVQKVFLFGYSWGAMLATAYANDYPTAVNGLILAEPGGFTQTDLNGYATRSHRIKLFDEATNDAFYHDQFLSGDKTDHEALDYKLALTAASAYAKNNAEGIEGSVPFWRYGAVVMKWSVNKGKTDGFDFKNKLAKFTTKVLFLYSQNNRAYGEAYAKGLATAFPNAQVAQVANTGHEMICFGWPQMQPLVLPYLASLR